MMATAIAWAALLAFVVLVFFAGLPDYVAELQRRANKRAKTGL